MSHQLIRRRYLAQTILNFIIIILNKNITKIKRKVKGSHKAKSYIKENNGNVCINHIRLTMIKSLICKILKIIFTINYMKYLNIQIKFIV